MMSFDPFGSSLRQRQRGSRGVPKEALLCACDVPKEE